MIQSLGHLDPQDRAGSVRRIARRAARAVGDMGQAAILLGPRRLALAVGYTDRTWRHATTCAEYALVGVYRDHDAPDAAVARTLAAQVRDDLREHLEGECHG